MSGKNQSEEMQMELAAVMPGEKQQLEATRKEAAAKELDTMQKKEIRLEEDIQKKVLLEREKENFTNIFALKCNNGWLKVYDNSAMILTTWLDGRLGRPYHRNTDMGYGTKAQYGVVSIPPGSVAEFVQVLAKAKIRLTYDDLWVLEFQLGERVSKEDMVRMLHEDELIIDKVNALVMPKEVMPGLRATVKTLLEFVHTIVRHQSESVKDIFLYEVEKTMIDLNNMVIAASRGYIKVDFCLQETGRIVEEMFEDATTMSDLRLVTAKQYKEFVDLIKKVEGEQARMIKRNALKEADVEIEKTKKREGNAKRAIISRGRARSQIRTPTTDR